MDEQDVRENNFPGDKSDCRRVGCLSAQGGLRIVLQHLREIVRLANHATAATVARLAIVEHGTSHTFANSDPAVFSCPNPLGWSIESGSPRRRPSTIAPVNNICDGTDHTPLKDADWSRKPSDKPQVP